uniref:C-type lectin domain-containing protein n=1 Tax=Erpetoichthys calabaricus TaxID=27687 RepID=A0A8C4RQH7_ERPCA
CRTVHAEGYYSYCDLLDTPMLFDPRGVLSQSLFINLQFGGLIQSSGMFSGFLLTTWKSYGQKSFATRNSKGTFEGGLRLCAEAGGQIAMAANEEENNAIASCLKTGEYDVNGKPVTFTKWKSGEPNNFNGNEDCTIINSEGIWNDINCEVNIIIICQFEPLDSYFLHSPVG